jgi:ADP-heptose:LPS heptosyltransferase
MTRRVVPERAREPFGDKVKKVAVIRECCIGDVLQTTPAVRALKAAFPKAEIHYYVGRWSKLAIVGNPAVDRIVEIPDYNGKIGSPLRRASFFLSNKKQKYDLVVCFNYGFFHGVECWLMGARIRVGLDDDRGMGCFFNVRIPYSPKRNRQLMYLDMIAAIAPIDDNNVGLEFHYDERDRQKFSDLLGPDNPEGPLIAISPGGGVNPFVCVSQKRWLPERFAAVADILHRRYGARIVLIGGQPDTKVAEQVGLRISAPHVNLAGSTSLRETGALLSMCSLLISNDSAPVFLASAVGCPTVVIYGPELSRLASPLGDSHIGLEADLPCRPCFPEPHCKKPECMDRISVDMVVRAAEQLLSKKKLSRENGQSCA